MLIIYKANKQEHVCMTSNCLSSIYQGNLASSQGTDRQVALRMLWLK